MHALISSIGLSPALPNANGLVSLRRFLPKLPFPIAYAA